MYCNLSLFSLVSIMHYTDVFNLPIEVADELTGKLLGRPKSATYRTADLVGLDIVSHALSTLKNGLPSTDLFKKLYDLPTWVLELIKSGALGQKSGKGFYEY
jgi:3-hydroxyacyl-CoA dehydrogenase